MICPRCKIENKKNFCIKCGYMIVKDKEVQINYNQNEENPNRLKEYIGNEEILTKIFNIKAAILGPLYYIYKKCYLIGYLFLIPTLLVVSFLFKYNQLLCLIFVLLISLFHYCFFNSIYTSICKKEIKKINKITKGNSITSLFFSLLMIVLIISIIVKK